MRADLLTLRDFRNYAFAELPLCGGVNVLCGENAQGKTNALEAVGLLSTTRLFRSAQKKDAIRFGAERCEVGARFSAGGREMTIKMAIPREGRPQLEVNGVRQKRHADAAGLLRSVLFCPEDLGLVREGAAARRRFLDTALCQLRPNYATYLSEYSRLLENKNRILKHSEEKPSLLETLDDFSYRMAMIGGHIVRYRAYYIRSLMGKAADIHAAVSGKKECLTYDYHTVSAVTDPFASASAIGAELWRHMQEHRAAEIATKSCLSGVHKDDLELLIEGRAAKAFASQGQVRTCALSLKLAERDMFFDDSGEYPILLLDDVLSELDARRQDFVLNRIGGGQVIITCCEPEKIREIGAGAAYAVENGVVTPLATE